MRVELDDKRLRQIQTSIPGATDAAIKRIAAAVLLEIQMNWSPAPPSEPGKPPAVDTGNLKGSTTFVPAGKLTYEVIVGAEYSLFLEYGTVNMAPRPFLLPAHEKIMANKDKYLDII